jgi:site-specific DNA-methyltransferase (adenine-specific)
VTWEVITGDALEVMARMADSSVDAIVTSPPYADQRAYEPGEILAKGARPSAMGRGSRGLSARSAKVRSAAPARWVEWIEPYTAEMLRVLSPTGSAMLNLGVVLRDGEEHECTDAILRNCRAQGWKLLHRLIWHKPNGQVPSAPGYLTVSHEFALWLAPTTRPWRAHEQPAGSQASREVRTPHAPASAARMTALYSGAGAHRKQGRKHRLHPDGARPTTVFTCAVGGQPNPDAHPARMPIELARHLVAMCCPPGGLVLDPFAGNATTGIVATRSGRRFLGIEIRADYADQARERLRDDRGLLEELDAEDRRNEQTTIDHALAAAGGERNGGAADAGLRGGGGAVSARAAGAGGSSGGSSGGGSSSAGGAAGPKI